MRRRSGNLADLQLLGFDFAQGIAGVMVEGLHRIAQLQGFVIHPLQAGAQLHHGDVQRGADDRQFVPALNRHLQAQIAIAQGLGQYRDAAGAAADRGLQTDEQIQRGQQQTAQHGGHHNELADRRAVVVIQALIQRHQRLLTQRGEVGEQGIETAFEILRLEVDAAAEHAVIQHLQARIEALEAVVVLPGPGLQGAGQARFEQACGFHQLLSSIADAAAQVAQLQAALQGELPGHHRGLTHRRQTTDPFDQVRCMLGGDLRQQVGFQPRCQRQAIVHGDLLAQGLQGAQGVGEAIIAIRPPADIAQAF
ncbi:hypothetical protein D3C86_1180610 [compost metagenome]